MPRIGVVAGLSMFVYSEEGGKHKEAHFHLMGGGVDVSLRLRDCQPFQGNLPRNKRKEVETYWRNHHGEITDNYNRVQRGEPVQPIED